MKSVICKGSMTILTIVCLLGFPGMIFADTINLGWNPPADGGPVDGYYLYYGLTNNIDEMKKIGPIYNTKHSIELERPNNERYYFYFTAFNSAGEGPTSEVREINMQLKVVQ